MYENLSYTIFWKWNNNFLNKKMKKIIKIIVLCLIVVTTKAQMPNVFPNNTQKADGILPLKYLGVPADTIFSKWGLAIKTGILYVGNGVKWNKVLGAGLKEITSIDSISNNNITAETFTSKKIRIFENNDSALANNLENGAEYYLPYNNGNYLKATVVEAFIQINIPANTSKTKTLNLNNIVLKKTTVEWGDGTSTISTSIGNYSLPHTYADSITPKIVKIYTDFKNIRRFSIVSWGLSEITNIDRLSKLQFLTINGGNLTKIPNITLNNTLQDIDFRGHKLLNNEVSNFLIKLNAEFIVPMGILVNQQTPAWALNALGIASKTNLENLGCFIIN